MDPKRKAVREAVGYFKNRGQFELYSGLEMIRSMKFERKQHEKNREAEESFVRERVWGWKDNESNKEDEDVGNEFVNFGEYNNQQLSPPRSILPSALLAGSILLGSLGGAAAYVMKQDDKPQDVPTMTEETIRLGLGRIEDYE